MLTQMLVRENMQDISKRQIPLTQGATAIISASDYSRVSQFKWHLQPRKTKRKDGSVKLGYYASGMVFGKSTLLHRFILGIYDSKIQVDHRDLDGLNCCRSNLRIATPSQNQANQICHNPTGFKGVHKNPDRETYRVSIGYKGKNIIIGCFRNPVAGALAYDEKARELFGDFARLNFPEKRC